MTKNGDLLLALLLGLTLICLFSVDARAGGVPYPGGDVKWDNDGKGGVRYPGGQVRWGQQGGGVRFPGGHVQWGQDGSGKVGINLPGVNFNVGW
jgi:hypothetical protein